MPPRKCQAATQSLPSPIPPRIPSPTAVTRPASPLQVPALSPRQLKMLAAASLGEDSSSTAVAGTAQGMIQVGAAADVSKGW